MAEDWRALNRANWEERTAVHLGPGGYDRSSHRAGRGTLDAIVEAELGPVAGLRVLHLQCHIGDDSVALAQRGAAEVVGVDFSPAAIGAARALAAELQLANARFVLSEVHGAPAALPGEGGSFDLVFTSWGTIGWYPDLAGWARVIAHFLRPGGALHFADSHPAALVFDDMAADAAGRPGWVAPYFERAGRIWDEPSDYADPAARLANSRTMTWLHPLSDILGALRAAGLRLDWLREHPRLTWQLFRCLVRDADGLWTWPDQPWLPLAVSLRALR
ncbi:class I SAM-dependent methyltransferase [Falsiroseomonas sp. CW058]|uniref:class I SAM-dependent methyltransferase n=1 Tax=Falsiroseomonas sp. CW058 TaxID=3388664 RepID=UPI003D3110DF